MKDWKKPVVNLFWGWTNVYGRGEVSKHRGYKLYKKMDFVALKYLPENWWYHVNKSGEGIAVDFPMKVRPVLSWSSENLQFD